MISRYSRITDRAEFDRALERLRDHLNDIAGDSRGSDPSLYVSESDIEFLRDELTPAGNGRPSRFWKKAVPITHEETTPHWLPRFNRPDKVVRDARGRPVVGYRIGYLNVSQYEAPVFFCSDGGLRMLIKHNYRQTEKTGPVISRGDRRKRTFTGYCRLPDPEFLYPVRTRGAMSGVSYNHGQTNVLETELATITGRSFPS